jgi:hypothetical protein
MTGRTSIVLALACVALWVGCENGSGRAQSEIIHDDVPRLREIVAQDLERGVTGVRSAGTKLARGFVIEDADRRAHDLRVALNLVRQPPRGIPELMISPVSFVAAVGTDGKVIARDGTVTPDPMAGFDARGAFEVVARALDRGDEGYAQVQFPSAAEDGTPSETVVYAAPARLDGRVVGAIIAGTPLWRTAQRLGRQLQADRADAVAQGMILWVYLFKGDALHHHGTPSDLDTVVPDAAARAAGLARSPGGFTGELQQYGRWYAYGVVPLPRLGPDVGMIAFRSDPPQ